VQVYFRKDEDSREEFEVCSRILPTTPFLSDVIQGERVICRYSALPFYTDVEAELHHMGARMVHSYEDHRYIASMAWVHDIPQMTFPTWFEDFQNIPENDHGYVVKGRTNSRKFDWHRRMFTPTKEGISQIIDRLLDDYTIANQGVVVRQYIPLRTFAYGINGLPITNEWRLFFLNGQFLTGAYYWSIFEPEFDPFVVPTAALNLAKEALAKTSLGQAFVVIDVAEGDDGRWWVVELNDGQMSGLSYNDPVTLYNAIACQG
jgi:hypothetical protein